MQRLPMIAVTARAMPGDIEAGIAVGFTAYLTKPLNIEQLLKTIGEFNHPRT